jgi:hypothetical protein
VLRLATDRDPTTALALGMAVASCVQGLLPYLAGRVMPVTGFPPAFVVAAACAVVGAALLTIWVNDRPDRDVSM